MFRYFVAPTFLACSALGRWITVGDHTDRSKLTGTSKSLAGVLLSAACASGFSRKGILCQSSPVRSMDASMEMKAELPQTGGNTEYCGEDVMSQKEHGTSSQPVQENLRWGVGWKLADRICNFNRHYAEVSGYFQDTAWLSEVDRENPTVYYDSVTGLPLYVAPIGRTMDDFIKETAVHGWPSFRQQEVVWENVRVLESSGEIVSKSGTHLGHNLPDGFGPRHCINLVSVAGRPHGTTGVDV